MMECEQCGKKSGYARIATKMWVCRYCANTQPLQSYTTVVK